MCFRRRLRRRECLKCRAAVLGVILMMWVEGGGGGEEEELRVWLGGMSIGRGGGLGCLYLKKKKKKRM